MNLPPGPRRPPAVQMLHWATQPLPFLDACARRYGERFTLRLYGFPPSVFVWSPQGVHEVFTGDPDVLLTGRGNDILEPVLGSNSLLVLDGPRHRRERRLLMPPFHGKRMQAYAGIIQEATLRALSGWKQGDELPLHEPMQQVSLEVILRAVFGVSPDELPRSARIMQDAVGAIGALTLFFPFLQRDLGPGSPGRRLLRSQEETATLIQERIQERRDRPDEDWQDILAMLMAARDEDGQPMSEDELRDELVTLLAAGHETTATGLAWAFHHILRNPPVLDRLLDELAPLGTSPDPTELSKLPYLAAACDETLRLQPVIPIVMRELAAPFVLMGEELPAGVRIAPCIYLVHRREDLYPEPLRFEPQRFLDRKFGPHEYLPFGGGARRCIGAEFARFEMRIVLGTILSRAKLDLVDPRTRTARRNVTVVPKEGTRVRIREIIA